MAHPLKLAQTLPDYEEMFKRIQSRPGVAGMMVVSSEGTVLYSSFDPSVSNQLRIYGLQFCLYSGEAIKDIDPRNQLNYVRLKSQRREIIVIPGDRYFIIVTCFADTAFHQ